MWLNNNESQIVGYDILDVPKKLSDVKEGCSSIVSTLLMVDVGIDHYKFRRNFYVKSYGTMLYLPYNELSWISTFSLWLNNNDSQIVGYGILDVPKKFSDVKVGCSSIVSTLLMVDVGIEDYKFRRNVYVKS